MALFFEEKVTVEKKSKVLKFIQDKLAMNLTQDLFKAQFSSNNN